MTTYYIYADGTLEYLGRLEAVDMETAQLLAGEIWDVPTKLSTHRLRFHLAIAA